MQDLLEGRSKTSKEMKQRKRQSIKHQRTIHSFVIPFWIAGGVNSTVVSPRESPKIVLADPFHHPNLPPLFQDNAQRILHSKETQKTSLRNNSTNNEMKVNLHNHQTNRSFGRCLSKMSRRFHSKMSPQAAATMKEDGSR